MHYERYSSLFHCGTLITPYESGQSSMHCYHTHLQKKNYKCFHSAIKHKLRIKVTGYHFIFLTPFLYLMTQKCLLLYLIFVSFYRPLFSCQQLSELLHHTSPSSCAIVCSILMHLVPKTLFPDSHHHV